MSTKIGWSACEEALPLEMPSLEYIDNLDEMLVAAQTVKECHRLLNKAGINVVSELLKGQGTFYQLNHYPEQDVYDDESHCQYYYHNHRGVEGEHGHFHTFIRSPAIPESIQPMSGFMQSEPWPSGEDALAHFICISMDDEGFPVGLFTTNRWVCAQTWYSAEDTIALLDRFYIDHAYPNLVVNQWITAMFVLFRPYIVALLTHRDKVIALKQAENPEVDVLEDRELDVTGSFTITIDQWVAQLTALMNIDIAL
ncbi:DUF6969 family protein [Psychromonas sp. KJ10-2]|uniref:DUF6969 family protein n=1 Tax=Psychromonas sp. KJ10-2 TaxID=3391822 RepID=UPI0039B4CD7A